MGWLEWLQGKKTYIVLIVAFVFNVGITAGWWTPDSQVWELINTILAFLGLTAATAKVNRVAKRL